MAGDDPLLLLSTSSSLSLGLQLSHLQRVCEEKRGKEKWEGVLCDGRRNGKGKGVGQCKTGRGRESGPTG
jgi:hypothetical protein